MSNIIHFLQKLFSLSHTESKGFVKLLIACLVALSLIFIPKFIKRQPIAASPEEAKKLDSLVDILTNKEFINEENTLFTFDPNTLPVDSLELLGFARKVAERAQNYRDKGGGFYTKEDLKKIYGLSDELYSGLHNYIDLPDSTTVKKESGLTKTLLNINNSNSTQLKKIPMIGDVLSVRIVRYREVLGGFISMDQIEEAYGLSDEAIASLKSSAFIENDFRPHQIKVNFDSMNVLKSHPYISNDLAEDMIRYREINSIIESETVLANFKSVDKSNFQKLILYLDFK